MKFHTNGKCYVGLWIATDRQTKAQLKDFNGNPYLTGSMEIGGVDYWVKVVSADPERLEKNPNTPPRQLILEPKQNSKAKPRDNNADFEGYEDASELL